MKLLLLSRIIYQIIQIDIKENFITKEIIVLLKDILEESI